MADAIEMTVQGLAISETVAIVAIIVAIRTASAVAVAVVAVAAVAVAVASSRLAQWLIARPRLWFTRSESADSFLFAAKHNTPLSR